MLPILNKAVLQPLNDPLFEEKKLKVFVLRDDLIHPFISGNKWRKLKYNLEEFRRQGKEYLVTFGGAYSNHIVATAAAGKKFGINTIGIIRGEEHSVNANQVLRFADECGMKLIFVSREKYRSLTACAREGRASAEWPALSTYAREVRASADRPTLPKKPGQVNSGLFILPEGGSNEFAVKGCKEIVDDIPVDFDYICCACGTGATFSGIVSVLKDHQQATGVAVLKGAGFIEEMVEKYAGTKNNFRVVHDYHFGGYAKSAKELDLFCRSFTEKNNIPVEPVYTGKLFFGMYDLARKDFFGREKTIIAVHTGGIYDFNILPESF